MIKIFIKVLNLSLKLTSFGAILKYYYQLFSIGTCSWVVGAQSLCDKDDFQ